MSTNGRLGRILAGTGLGFAEVQVASGLGRTKLRNLDRGIFSGLSGEDLAAVAVALGVPIIEMVPEFAVTPRDGLLQQAQQSRLDARKMVARLRRAG